MICIKPSKGWVITILIVSSMLNNIYESSMLIQPDKYVTLILIINDKIIRDYDRVQRARNSF